MLNKCTRENVKHVYVQGCLTGVAMLKTCMWGNVNNEWGKFGKLLITSTRRDAEQCTWGNDQQAPCQRMLNT